MLTVNVRLDRLVRQDRAAVDVDLVADGDIVAQHGDVLEAGPLADGAVPADDGGLDPGVVLDLAALEQHAALQAHAVADDDTGTDGDVWTDAAALADLGRRIDQDVAAVYKGLRVRHEQLGALLRERGQVQAGAGEEVLGLADVHPEAVQVERVQLAVLADGREDLLLDGRRAQLDAPQHRRVQHVDARVDAVAHELDRLLDEAVDARGVARLMHDDAIFGGLLDLGDDDGALVAVLLVELGQLLEGVVADDVRVEDEEGVVVLAQDLLCELEGACRAQRFALDRECDLDVELLLVLLAVSLPPAAIVFSHACAASDLCRLRAIGGGLLTCFMASAMISGL